MRKPVRRFETVSEAIRKEIYHMWLTNPNNSYDAIGKKYGLNHSMVGKIIDVHFDENRKRRE